MKEDGLRYESRVVRIVTRNGETTEEVIDVLEIYWNEEQAKGAMEKGKEDEPTGVSIEALEDAQEGYTMAAMTAEVVRADVKEWLEGKDGDDD
jgi:hypothetical protein